MRKENTSDSVKKILTTRPPISTDDGCPMPLITANKTPRKISSLSRPDANRNLNLQFCISSYKNRTVKCETY